MAKARRRGGIRDVDGRDRAADEIEDVGARSGGPRYTRSAPPALSTLARGFEKFNRITVGVFQLDLFAAGTDLHIVAETQAQFLEL